MQHLKEVTVPQFTKLVLDYVSCDLCKQKIEPEDCYEVRETEVRLRQGASYPEGGHGTEIKIDICCNCFIRTLVLFLESRGCNISEREWDY
jgi:hypothetical protein